MAGRAETFGLVLLVTFLLGGVVAPALHFQMHAHEEDHEAIPVDVAHWADTDYDAHADCVLCDATFLGAESVGQGQADMLAGVQQVPALTDRIGSTLVGLISNRGPPVHLG